MKRILLCMILLISVLLCACNTEPKPEPSPENQYELIFEKDALVLKENGKTRDTWDVEDISAISGYVLLGFSGASTENEEEIRTMLKTLFSDGVALSLTTADVVELDSENLIQISMFGIACGFVPDWPVKIFDDSVDFSARLYMVRPASPDHEAVHTFVFSDREGYYYTASPEDEIGELILNYMIKHHHKS